MLQEFAKVTTYKTSYRAGLLQAKAFRILKKKTNQVLEQYNINATDWGILGLLYDNPKGITYKKIATEMGVKAPFVTRSIAALVEKKYCTFVQSTTDGRAKIATITPKGSVFVKKTEKVVMQSVLRAFKGTSKRNVLGYILTMVSIVENNQSDITNTNLDHMV